MPDSQISQLVFPSYLRADEYKKRCVTFYVGASAKNRLASSDEALRESFDKSTSEMVESPQDSEIFSAAAKLLKTGTRVEATVTLPYPNSLSDNQQHAWNLETGSVTADIAMKALGTSFGPKTDDFGGNPVNVNAKRSGLVKMAGRGVNDIVSAAVSGMNMNGNVALGRMANMMGTRKPVADPAYFQNYSGTQPRTFNMSYTFVPMNQQEAQAIKDIILFFKQYSSPGYCEYTPIMMSPYTFTVDFSGNQYISQMFNMYECVLTNLSVDYGADGAFSLFQDGFPKQINLAMTFAESKITYAEEYAGKSLE